jgi:hypothetical protein
MRDLTDLLLAIAPETIPEGTVFLLGSLTQLQNEGLQGYSSSGVKIREEICWDFQEHDCCVVHSPPPPPPPMGGIANPQLIRSMMDGCNWLASIPGYPLKNSMQSIVKIAAEGAGGGRYR